MPGCTLPAARPCGADPDRMERSRELPGRHVARGVQGGVGLNDGRRRSGEQGSEVQRDAEGARSGAGRWAASTAQRGDGRLLAGLGCSSARRGSEPVTGGGVGVVGVVRRRGLGAFAVARGQPAAWSGRGGGG
jgi:hypothetical protein